jgi:hypothetical protein
MEYVLIKPDRPSGQYTITAWQVLEVQNGRTVGSSSVPTLERAQESAKVTGWPVRMFHDCVVCGMGWPESYKVHNAVWREAGLGRGIAHVGCLEGLLSRPLTLADFPPDVPINEVFAFGVRMAMEDTGRSPSC